MGDDRKRTLGGRAESEASDTLPDPEKVASRGEGRPPEENPTADPVSQSQVILEESEERLEETARRSDSPSR